MQAADVGFDGGVVAGPDDALGEMLSAAQPPLQAINDRLSTFQQADLTIAKILI